MTFFAESVKLNLQFQWRKISMKKVFLVLARVFAFLAAIVFGISLILPGIVDQTVPTSTDFIPDNTMFGMLIQIATPQAVLFFLGFAFIGCALVLFGKNIAKYIGYASEFVSGFFVLFAVFEILESIKAEPKMAMGFGAILAVVGLILVVAAVVLESLAALVAGFEPKKSDDETIDTILKYKKLLDQGIIPEDIFLAKRDKLLGISEGKNELTEE